MEAKNVEIALDFCLRRNDRGGDEMTKIVASFGKLVTVVPTFFNNF